MNVFIPEKTGSTLRLAIVSDSHGRLDARVAEVARDCDYVVHAGDIGNWAVLEQLQPRQGQVIAVRGNNDVAGKWPDAAAVHLGAIPWEAAVALPGGELVVVHGHQYGAAKNRHRRLRAAFPQARCIVYGHSHRMVLDREAIPWVLNPGACGTARTYGGPSCAVLQAQARGWELEMLRFPAGSI